MKHRRQYSFRFWYAVDEEYNEDYYIDFRDTCLRRAYQQWWFWRSKQLEPKTIWSYRQEVLKDNPHDNTD